MYLARGALNPASREVQRDLASPVALHQTLMRAFPDGLGDEPRKSLGLLYRVEQTPRALVLFVQSVARPDFTRLPFGYFLAVEGDLDLALASDGENPRVRAIDDERARISVGERFVFRLRANATRKIDTKSGPDGARRNGKRVPVRGDEARLAWLARKGSASGFRVVNARVLETGAERGRSHERTLTFAGATFDGVLEVTDAEAFRKALAEGIGPAKAFGFGLLSIQRVPATELST